MEKEFLPYEESLTLKELGFDEPCFGYFSKEHDNKLIISDPYYASILIKNDCLPTPLYQQAFDWFEQKHSMFIARSVNTTVNEILNISYYVESWKFSPVEVEFNENPYDSFDNVKARIACVRKLIELVKKEK